MGRMRSGPLARAMASAALLVMAGCAGQPDVAQWQARFERYVHEQANDDLNAMRGLIGDTGQATFAVYGEAEPGRSRDVIGLWLGSHASGDRPWQVFLVGVIDQREVREVRVAAVTRDGTGRWRWRVGEGDEAAMTRYRRYHVGRDETRPREGPPDAVKLADWPAPRDDYRLEAEGATLVVTEQASGASWRLSLEDAEAGSPLSRR